MPLGVDYPRAVLLAVLVVVNLALVGAASTSGAPYGPYNDAWDGSSSLRTTAADTSQVTLAHSATAYEDADPDGTVAFVVAPQEPYGPADRARVRQFASRGGTVVVASDDNRTNRLLAALGVRTRIGDHLVRDDRNNYRNASLPVATNVSDRGLAAGVDGLTLNYGTVLRLDRPRTPGRTGTDGRVRVLVGTSEFSYLDANGNGMLDDTETLRSYPVAAAERVGEGRVVVVSDASVFTNAMLERSGNRAFLDSLAGRHERVVLDYSHGHPLPPLVYGLVVVRGSAPLQALLGGLALGAVGLWAWRPAVGMPGWVPGRGTARTPDADAQLREAELAAFLTERHPEWDEESIQRVTEAIIRRRERIEGNE